MTFYYLFPLFGMVVWEYGGAEMCLCDRECLEEIWSLMIADDCWTMARTCIRWVFQPHTTAYILLHRSYRLHVRNRAGRTRAGDAFYHSDDAYCRLVTSALELWPRRSPHRHGAPSPSFVLRSPCADRRFFLRPAAEPMTYSGRPPRLRPHRRSSSAVQPRDVSPILTILSDLLPNNHVHIHSVGTYILVVVIVIFIWSTAPNS